MLQLSRRAMRALAVSGAILVGLALSTEAQARYTAVDESGRVPLKYTFGGYCDTFAGTGHFGLNQCDTVYTLPYSVTFKGGITNEVVIRSDGRLDFVTGVKVSSPPDPTRPFGDALWTVDSDIHDGGMISHQLVSIGVPKYTERSGLPVPGKDLPNRNEINFNLEPVFTVTWFTFERSTPIPIYSNRHTARLTPGVDGFTVEYSNKASELIRASISPLPHPLTSGAPEPDVWAMLVLGFGALGATLRRRRAADAAA